MDEFMIYDYALSHPEVAYLALNGFGLLYQPLEPDLGLIDFNEDGRIDIFDFSSLAELWLKSFLWP